MYTAAGSQALFDTAGATWCGAGCGTCFNLTSTGSSPCSGCGTGGVSGESIVVMVTNLCPYNGNQQWCPQVGLVFPLFFLFFFFFCFSLFFSLRPLFDTLCTLDVWLGRRPAPQPPASCPKKPRPRAAPAPSQTRTRAPNTLCNTQKLTNLAPNAAAPTSTATATTSTSWRRARSSATTSSWTLRRWTARAPR